MCYLLCHVFIVHADVDQSMTMMESNAMVSKVSSIYTSVHYIDIKL